VSREAEVRKIVIDYCRRLYDGGFLPGIDGNVSMRLDENTAVVTPTGVCKATVREDELVTMTLDGEVVRGHMKPSCETPMHLTAYVHRPEVNAVIHAHSPNVLAFAMAGRSIDLRYAPFTYEHIGAIADVGFGTPGSDTLHQGVTAAVKKGYTAILLQSHGSIILGADMLDAFVNTDLLEAYAGMLIKAEALGGARMLTEEQLNEISCGYHPM
jgi:L-fuculose-phosphate aldolase